MGSFLAVSMIVTFKSISIFKIYLLTWGQFLKNRLPGKIQKTEIFPRSCSEAWKYFLRNLVWLNNSNGFYGSERNEVIEMKKLKQCMIKLNPIE